jgi:hypothetical protein
MNNWGIKFKNQVVKGFNARIEFLFTSTETSQFPKPYNLRITENKKQPYLSNITYWIGEKLSLYNDSIEHISLVGTKNFEIRINLLDGYFINNAFVKNVLFELISYPDENEHKEIVWSKQVNVFTKDVTYPTIDVNLNLVNNILYSKSKIFWDRDSDFNFNSKAFKLRTTLISNTTNEELSTVLNDILNENTIVNFFLPNNFGSYTVINDLMTFSGVSVLTDRKIYTNIEKPLEIYLARSLSKNKNIKFNRQLYKGFIKTNNQIKKISEFKVKD